VRILHVAPITLYPKEKGLGGMRSYVLNMQKYLGKHGIGMDVMAASLGKNQHPKNILLVDTSKKSDILFSLHVLSPYLRALKNYDAVHYSSPFLTLPVMLLLTRKPTIISFHGPWSPAVRYKKGLLAGAMAYVVELFSVILAGHLIMPDASTRQYYLRKYPFIKQKTTLIPIGVDVQEFTLKDKNRLRKKYHIASQDDVVLSVGRLEKEKNIELMLQAFKIIRERDKKAKLIVVGEGRERQNLENMARSLNLNDVVFMGAVDYARMADVMNTADVFILTSMYESGPIVAEEALACGLPLVSVDVGRIREFIQPGTTGVIVKRDKEDLAIEVLKLLEHKRPRLRKECHLQALTLSFDRTAEQTIGVYRRLLTP
jgi:glycosyltransferase involved in cell wall biosynthesis